MIKQGFYFFRGLLEGFAVTQNLENFTGPALLCFITKQLGGIHFVVHVLSFLALPPYSLRSGPLN